jgi:energy-coupling factor transport system ATP-binding protein
MHRGRIAIDGPPAAVFEQRERLLELGLGLPIAVDIAHQLRQAGLPLPAGLLTVPALVQALCG